MLCQNFTGLDAKCFQCDKLKKIKIQKKLRQKVGVNTVLKFHKERLKREIEYKFGKFKFIELMYLKLLNAQDIH